MRPEGRDVPRETEDRLRRFSELIQRWNRRINLVADAAPQILENRHFRDSAQLLDLVDFPARWVDLGSGGGFPAIVVAILADHIAVTCIEADRRKAAFLQAVSRELELDLDIRAERIELVPPLAASVVSARALAPLPRLLGYVVRHLALDGVALLPKGEKWREELEAARRTWHFNCEAVPSATHQKGAILRIGDLRRA